MYHLCTAMPARPHPPLAVALLAAAAAGSCGRVAYTDYPIEGVEISHSTGTLPPGGATDLVIQALPGPFVPGTHIHLSLELGLLQVGETVAETVSVPIPEDGRAPPVRAIVPVNVEPGRILELTAPEPISGDLEIEVVEPALVPHTIGDAAYEVIEGFVLDAPVASDPGMIAGRAERLAAPTAGSSGASQGSH